MRCHRFTLGCLEEEKMWEFSMGRNVLFHFVNKIEDPDLDPLTAALTRKYVYDGFMDEETYLLFRLMVPTNASK